MHAAALNTNRRSFLKMGAVGVAVIAGGGYLATRLTDGSADPILEAATNLTAPMQQMLYRIYDGVLHGMLPEGREHELLTKTLAVTDAGISGLQPHLQKELTGLFGLMTVAPARKALTGRWGGWQNASRDDVLAWLADLRVSDNQTRRLIYITLHDLATANVYALEESWELVGYHGPLFVGPGEEV